MPQFNINALIIPIASSLVGLIPMILNLTVNWMDRRSQTARINNILLQTNQRVSFLTNWFNLQKDVCEANQLPGVKAAVSEELNDVYELFMDVVLDPDKATKQRREAIAQYRKTNKVRRYFLLYQPYNVHGWFFHTLYYMCLFPLFAAIGFIIYEYVQTQTWVGLTQEYIFAAVVVFTLAGIFRVFGRRAAKDIEERVRKLDQKPRLCARNQLRKVNKSKTDRHELHP